MRIARRSALVLLGSSMVAGRSALACSCLPHPEKESLRDTVRKLANTADSLACPADLSIYAPFPSVSNGAPQVCTGGTGYNSFNGHGQINALSAVR